MEEEWQTTPLHYAAGTGDLPALQEFCQPEILNEIDINAHDPQGRTPLIYAVLADQLECMLLLLTSGCDINATDTDGRTPLHWAAFHGKHSLVKILLENGAAVLGKDGEGRTPLHLSTGCESSKCTKLIAKFLDGASVDETDGEGMTAAHWSAFHNHAKHLDLLIDKGCNLLLADKEGRVPLHWTSTNASATTCSLILASEPESINKTDREGRTPLHLAVANNNLHVVETLISLESCDISAPDNMRRTPLHWAAVLGNNELAAVLLQSGASSAAADENGATALHYAAQYENSNCLSAMLQHSQVADVPDNEGRTALMWAAGKGMAHAIEVLVHHSFDLQAFDKSGGTALHVASFTGHLECVNTLLLSGAVVDPLDGMQHTPLFRACEVGHADIVQVLIDAGASLDIADNDGRTPLHWAAMGGFESICEMIIAAKAKIDARDHHGRTPLHCVTYAGRIECLALLIKHGADVSCQDMEGISSLHWACSSGNLPAVKMLLEAGAFVNHMEVDGDKLTPLDYATMSESRGAEHDQIIEMLMQHGALPVTAIRDVAATAISSWWRGERTRRLLATQRGLEMKAANNWQLHKKGADPGAPVPASTSPSGAHPTSPRGVRSPEPAGTVLSSSGTGSGTSLHGLQDDQASIPTFSKQATPSVSAAVSKLPSTTSSLRGSQVASRTNVHASTSVTGAGLEHSSSTSSDLPTSSDSRQLTGSLAASASVLSVEEVARAMQQQKLEARKELLRKAAMARQHSMSEGDRVRSIRRTVEAAMIIQLAVRRFLGRRRRQRIMRRRNMRATSTEPAPSHASISLGQPTLPSSTTLEEAKGPIAPTSSPLPNTHAPAASASTTDKKAWRFQIAALTIQLAWRQYKRRKMQMQSQMTKRKGRHPVSEWAPSVLAEKQRLRVFEIYSTPSRSKPYTPPRLRPMHRPAYMSYIVPPAVTSFNFAVDSYAAASLSTRTQKTTHQRRERQQGQQRREHNSPSSKTIGGGAMTASRSGIGMTVRSTSAASPSPAASAGRMRAWQYSMPAKGAEWEGEGNGSVSSHSATLYRAPPHTASSGGGSLASTLRSLHITPESNGSSLPPSAGAVLGASGDGGGSDSRVVASRAGLAVTRRLHAKA